GRKGRAKDAEGCCAPSRPLRILGVLRGEAFFFISSGFGGVALLLPGPVEPRQERLDIALLDRRPGPDADAGRRGAMAGEIVAGAFGLEPRRHRPDRLEPPVR